jgi:hypothetical protein
MLPQSRKSARSYPQPKKRIQFLRKNWTSSLIRFSKRFVPENLILFLVVWVFWKYGWTLITVSKDGKRRNLPQFWDGKEPASEVRMSGLPFCRGKQSDSNKFIEFSYLVVIKLPTIKSNWKSNYNQSIYEPNFILSIYYYKGSSNPFESKAFHYAACICVCDWTVQLGAWASLLMIVGSGGHL